MKVYTQVEEPNEIPRALQKAIKIALSGRRGPVYVDFRETALVREASEKDVKNILNPEEYRSFSRPTGSLKEIQLAVKILENAKKPIIVAGGGVIASEASSELKLLSETYLIPTGTTINGIGSIGSDSSSPPAFSVTILMLYFFIVLIIC